MPNTQAAIAATIAYLICAYLWRQPNPVFAAVSCYLALGFSRNRQPRRVLEIGVGVSFGVLIGELAARAIGFGWWQLLLILLVTPLLARMMDRSDLMTFQSAINAMVVAALAALATQHDLPHSSVGRWVDSLTGALVGLVAAVVFPTSITTRPRRYTSTAMHRLGEALEAMGKGLSRGDAELVSAAQGYLDEARRQLTDGQAAQSSAADIAALNPRLRGERRELAELDRLLEIAGRLQIALQMLVRQARGVVGEIGPNPRGGELVSDSAQAMRHLASSVGHWNKPVRARREALDLAHQLAPLEVARSNDWRTTSLVSLLRAVVVDLLQLTGLSLHQARAALADAPTRERSLELGLEDASGLWGTETFPAIRTSDATSPQGGAGDQAASGSR